MSGGLARHRSPLAQQQGKRDPGCEGGARSRAHWVSAEDAVVHLLMWDFAVARHARAGALPGPLCGALGVDLLEVPGVRVTWQNQRGLVVISGAPQAAMQYRK